MKAKGARAVVTGAGSGIGKATALRLAGSGVDEVACVDIDGEAAEETASACEALGGAASARLLPFVPGRLQALATRTPLHRIVV